MKTKLLFTFLVAVLTFSLSAQYKPMLDNPTWNIRIYGFTGAQDVVIEAGTNVVIGSYTYKKFHDPVFDTDVYLREDVAAKKVYKRENNADQLLYDFSLTNGSSIVLSNGNTYTATVSTINVEGGTRKSITLDNGFFSGGHWVEGVGDLHHPLIAEFALPSDPYLTVTCSTINGTAVYNQGIANGGTPTDCSMLLGTGILPETETALAPNPFTTDFRIVTNKALLHADLKIVNIYGQIVKEITDINGQSINFSRNDLADGVYIVQLFQDDKLIYRQKVVAAH